MESNEEPQRKVFKARKTMRASDRQHLHKVKEEFLKTTDKLLNGKHENRDSDLNSPSIDSDCPEEKEVNGIEDVCLDSEETKRDSEEISHVQNPEIKETQANDLTPKLETLSPENIASEQDHVDTHNTSSPDSESQVLNCHRNNDLQEEVNINDDLNCEDTCVKDNLDHKATPDQLDDENKLMNYINETSTKPVETKELILTPALPMEGEKSIKEAVVKYSIGEEAISSSINMDTNKDAKDENVQSTDLLGTSSQKALENEPVECVLGNTATIETDEIIPILEKLAPAEDALNCFSKSVLLPVENPNLGAEDKMEYSLRFPSKHESNESLPKEPFLVLSDEEELCCDPEMEIGMPNSHASLSEDTEKEKEKEVDKMEEKGEDKNEEEKEKEERPPERSEALRRKHSKSEDMDNVHSKRRRCLEEEYEAEFEVKITSRGEVNQKLEKVIHRFLEEKFSALQYAIFEKNLTDLKTRVDKIECSKRHKTVLTELQSKIARLTKRFGAAKEDSKKRTETLRNAPHSPGKATSDTGSINNVAYRNAGTVRQMLESKRNVGDSTPVTFQSPANTVSVTTLTTSQRAVSGLRKPQTPVTSTPLTSGSLTTSVLSTANTATVVGISQVAGGNTKPISLQSLPVILHVPVAMSPQDQLLQGHTGTLVTNQQSGNVEFIPVQSQPNVGNLTKTSLALSSMTSAKANNSPSIQSTSIQRNSPASVGTIGAALAAQAVSTAHPVAQATRTTLADINTSGVYTPPSNRSSIQMKIPLSASSCTALSEISTTTASRIESETSRLLPPQLATTDIIANKKTPEAPSQSGKATNSAGGVIDLTLDDEEDGSSQGGKKQNQNIPGVSMSTLATQPKVHPLQPVQLSPLQLAGAPSNSLSQTTIHVLPTAQTTVNVTHHPVTQAPARLPGPLTGASANHQMVYTTLPTPSGQNPVQTTVMQSPSLRLVNPQSSGVTVRMPQTTVNSGLALGSVGPQLTVHHRPPQVHSELLRPVYPAPLPEAPQPPRLPLEAASISLPQKPHLKLARVQSQNGIVLSWSVLEVDRSCASVDSYHLYAYHEDPSATVPSQWKKIGEVKALPLPMACTLTQFVSGSKYYFAVRAKDIYGRFGPFCDPQSTDVIASQSS